MAHLCAGVKTNVVAAVAITDAYSNDSPQFGPLVRKTAEGFNINEISADMAYSSRNNPSASGKWGWEGIHSLQKECHR